MAVSVSSLNRRTIFHSRAHWQRLLDGPVVVDLDEYGFTSARWSLALRCLLRGYHSRAGIYPTYFRYCRCQWLIGGKWSVLTDSEIGTAVLYGDVAHDILEQNVVSV